MGGSFDGLLLLLFLFFFFFVVVVWCFLVGFGGLCSIGEYCHKDENVYL